MESADISRKNLISSLAIGLAIGGIAGAFTGWVAHRFYAEQRLANVLICREKNKNQPEYVLQSMCGSRF